MTESTLPPKNERLQLKQPVGWFAAGDSFQRALRALSDGAFKLFAHLCLGADRSTGRFQATHRELATVLGKSKRVIGSYVEELQHKGVCVVLHGRNQYAPSWLQITDEYWPYRRLQDAAAAATQAEQIRYVAAIRDAFVGSGCSGGRFGSADVRSAKALKRRGLPLSVVLDAILLGSCRKYISRLNGGVPQIIASLAYFEPLIAEVSREPLAEDYRQYLRHKNQQLAESWSRKLLLQQEPQKGGYPDVADSEIIQWRASGEAAGDLKIARIEKVTT